MVIWEQYNTVLYIYINLDLAFKENSKNIIVSNQVYGLTVTDINVTMYDTHFIWEW